MGLGLGCHVRGSGDCLICGGARGLRSKAGSGGAFLYEASPLGQDDMGVIGAGRNSLLMWIHRQWVMI